MGRETQVDEQVRWAGRRIAGSRAVKGVAVGAVLTGLGAYGLASLLMTGPLNPVQLAHGTQVRAVMEPFFRQNWSLFAPDPVSIERGLLARVRCGQADPGAFVDLTTPRVQALQADRFFPTRESRVLSNPLHVVFAPDPLAQAVRSSKERREEGVQTVRTESEQASKAEGERLLARAVSRMLAADCAGSPVSAVQLRYVMHEFPRWSERERRGQVGEVRTLDSAWLEVV